MRVMNRPSTVKESGYSVIMPLMKIHATPTRVIRPSTRESTRIMGRKLPPLLLVFDGRGVGFGILTPKLVARAVDKDVFQRGLADGNCLDLAREGFDHVRNEAVAGLLLDANLIPKNRRADVESVA